MKVLKSGRCFLLFHFKNQLMNPDAKICKIMPAFCHFFSCPGSNVNKQAA